MITNIVLNEEQMKEFYEMYHSIEETSPIMDTIYDKIVDNIINKWHPKKIIDLKSDCWLVFEKVNKEFIIKKLDLQLGKYLLALETIDRHLSDMNRIVFKINGSLNINKQSEDFINNVVGIHIVFNENIDTHKLFLNKLKSNIFSEFNSDISLMVNGNVHIEYYKTGINISIKPIDKL